MTKNFAVVGVAGYIAPRHLKAIRDTGNKAIAAYDPHDSVGILDQYSLEISFFTEFERFDRHLEKLRLGPEENRIHYVSICSPNYLHDAHCRQALRVGANVICEKPLVINPWNLDALQDVEMRSGGKINTMLQLRVHPKLIELRNNLIKNSNHIYNVDLTYITARGQWYHHCWKGIEEKSGGVATNIGIHFFDLLLWLFGPRGELKVYHKDNQRVVGFMELEHARVKWFLSINSNDLPFKAEPGQRSTFRSIVVDGTDLEFTDGFNDLHTRIYEETLAGKGFGIDTIRPATELTYAVRMAELSPRDDFVHSFLKK